MLYGREDVSGTTFSRAVKCLQTNGSLLPQACAERKEQSFP